MSLNVLALFSDIIWSRISVTSKSSVSKSQIQESQRKSLMSKQNTLINTLNVLRLNVKKIRVYELSRTKWYYINLSQKYGKIFIWPKNTYKENDFGIFDCLHQSEVKMLPSMVIRSVKKELSMLIFFFKLGFTRARLNSHYEAWS